MREICGELPNIIAVDYPSNFNRNSPCLIVLNTTLAAMLKAAIAIDSLAVSKSSLSRERGHRDEGIGGS